MVTFGNLVKLQVKAGNSTKVLAQMTLNATTVSVMLNNLTTGATYSVRVVAYTRVGAGPYSQPVNTNRQATVIANGRLIIGRFLGSIDNGSSSSNHTTTSASKRYGQRKYRRASAPEDGSAGTLVYDPRGHNAIGRFIFGSCSHAVFPTQASNHQGNTTLNWYDFLAIHRFLYYSKYNANLQ